MTAAATVAYYPIMNGSTAQTDGYFEIPGNFTAMFVAGFSIVAWDSGSGSPAVSTATTFTVGSSSYSGGTTKIVPYCPGSPPTTPSLVGSPAALNCQNISAALGTWTGLLGGAYNLEFTDPNCTAASIVVAAASTNTSTSMEFPGRGVLNYGELINENLLHLMENFASYAVGSPPGPDPNVIPNPVPGQMWFDKSTPALRVFVPAAIGSPPVLACFSAGMTGDWTNVAAFGVNLPDLADVDDLITATAAVGDVVTWDGSKWTNLPPGSLTGVNIDEFVATGGQTVFNTTNVPTVAPSGSPGNKAYIQVFVNGILQKYGPGFSYTVTGANQITFNSGLTLNDDVTIYEL